ncbi:hypothetical protein SERLA73DRAFT_176179 [Serpula lacrymans var. lacrymans S7.3]|uniref:F-box domain-containing protein n=2 Tax=Serpula lacrymans var. lacrymans TaxID=341189 RepID=F8PMG5_SERL3|nr:uncharacterized protein SERLADRAFT_458963 [Serpula lacrymans var. lacrymans S7.9]EGO02797.1 hypothetical protein SERLA73DRAFT_176179 [Serpula lacrymans var. lacrymans S7.3]EGO28496.1 hypothetical protein SERLADRAFT_458963 [Serpula lacrymans var. lacrymans S7.9]
MSRFNIGLGVLPIPAEVTEHTLTHCHPRDVASFSQTCRRARSLVYSSPDQYLWRQLFLSLPFDDPRTSLRNDSDSDPGQPYNWKMELQTRIQAELTALGSNSSPEELRSALDTFVSVVRSASPVTQGNERVPSQSLLWVVRVLQESNLLSRAPSFTQRQSPYQPLHRLRSYLALTLDDNDDEESVSRLKKLRTRSRCTVYDLRNYGPDNSWGPLTSTGEVSWVHAEAIINVVLMNLSEYNHHWVDTRPPCGLEATRAYSAPGATSRSPSDWAGVEGTWRRFVCFMDYRDLFAFNFSSRANGHQTTFFDDTNFQEAIRLIELTLQLIPSDEVPKYFTLEPLPDCPNPNYPTLYFTGTSWGVHGNEATVIGSVSMGLDDVVRWRFTRKASIHEAHMQWSSEGVQIGSVASAAGVVGTWTGAHHEHGDPVGPFWLWRVQDDHPSYLRAIQLDL